MSVSDTTQSQPVVSTLDANRKTFKETPYSTSKKPNTTHHKKPAKYKSKVLDATRNVFNKMFDFKVYNFIILTLTLLICWLPWYTAMAPFGADYDTYVQLYWSQGYPAFDPGTGVGIEDEYIASDHHPFLLSFIYGFSHDLGELFFSNGTMGLAALAYSQVIIFALEIVFLFLFLRKHKVPSILCGLLFIFIAVNPLYPILLAYLSKETTSIIFFVPWLICFAKLVIDITRRKEIPTSLIVWTIIFSLLSMLTKKTYLVVVIFSLFALLVYAFFIYRKRANKRIYHKRVNQIVQNRFKNSFTSNNDEIVSADNIKDIENDDAATTVETAEIPIKESVRSLPYKNKKPLPVWYKTNWNRMVQIIVPILIGLFIFQCIVLPLARVRAGGIQEMLAVPIQQISAVLTENRGVLSYEDEEVIANLLDIDEVINSYNSGTADDVKWIWNTENANPWNVLRFLEVWYRTGWEAPTQYYSSLEYLQRFFDFDSIAFPDSFVAMRDFYRDVDETFLPDYDINYMTDKQNDVWNIINNSISDNIWCTLIFTCPLYTLIFPLVGLVIIFLRRPRNLLLAIPIILIWLSLFTVPAFLARYMFPFILLVPYIIGIACLRIPTHKPKRHKIKVSQRNTLPESAQYNDDYEQPAFYNEPVNDTAIIDKENISDEYDEQILDNQEDITENKLDVEANSESDKDDKNSSSNLTKPIVPDTHNIVE